MARPSSLFISHGSPDLIFHDTAAKRFLQHAADSFAPPKGIVIASAHFETERPAIVSDPAPEMIYDFGPIDRRLNDVVYPALGDPALAEKAASLLVDAGIECDLTNKRGYDHGTWVPLSLLYKDAEIPIVQLSVQRHLSASRHYDVGKALRPLVDEEILVIGSGSMTHNLAELFGPMGLKHQRGDDEVEWARSFADWMNAQITAGNVDELLDYEAKAPFARENHPTAEHFLPLMVALGASSNGQGERLHKSTEFAILAMDAFAFH